MPARSEPQWYIQVQPDGSAGPVRLPDDINDKILSLEYGDEEKKSDILKLTVENYDLEFFDNPVWFPGTKIIVSWGYPGRMSQPRESIIQKVTGSTVLTVEGQSKAVLMNKNTKSRTFDKMTRSEVIRKLAKEQGYGESEMHVQDTTQKFDHILQANETDAQFIKRLATAEHYEFYVDFDGFHWHERKLGQKPVRLLMYFLAPQVGDILSFSVENSVFGKKGKVKTEGRDPLTKKDVKGEGSNSKTERDSLNPVTEIIAPDTGLSSFNVAAEETKPTTATTEAAAKKEADGSFKKNVQATVKLKIEMIGDPLIVGKSVIEVQGISKRLSGLYYIDKIKHKIDSSGYRTSIECSTNGTNKGGGDKACANCKAAAAAVINGLVDQVKAGKLTEAEAAKRRDAEIAKCDAICSGKAKVNNQKADGGDADGLLTEEISGEDGGSRFIYKDSAGRQNK